MTHLIDNIVTINKRSPDIHIVYPDSFISKNNQTNLFTTTPPLFPLFKFFSVGRSSFYQTESETSTTSQFSRDLGFISHYTF